MLFSQYVSQYLSEKKAKKAKYILLWTMLYRSLLDTHKYEWVNLLDFQYAKKKQKLNTHKSTQCIKFFEVKIYCYFSSEDSSKLFINVKEYIKILNCLIKKIRYHYCYQNSKSNANGNWLQWLNIPVLTIPLMGTLIPRLSCRLPAG